MGICERNLFHPRGFSPQSKHREMLEAQLVPFQRPNSGQQRETIKWEKNDSKGAPFIEKTFIKFPLK